MYAKGLLDHIDDIKDYGRTGRINQAYDSGRTLFRHESQASSQMMQVQANAIDKMQFSQEASKIANNWMSEILTDFISPKKLYNQNRVANDALTKVFNSGYPSGIGGNQFATSSGPASPGGASTAQGLYNPSTGMGIGGQDSMSSLARTDNSQYWWFGFIDNIYTQLSFLRNAVDIPADDVCRADRRFYKRGARRKEIEMRQEAEKRCGIRKSIRHGIKMARLYGGSAGIISLLGERDELLRNPLDFSTLQKGQLKAFNTIMKDAIIPMAYPNTDITGENFMQPEYYAVVLWQISGLNFAYDNEFQKYTGEIAEFMDEVRSISNDTELNQFNQRCQRARVTNNGMMSMSGIGSNFMSPYAMPNFFVHRSRVVTFGCYDIGTYNRFKTLYWEIPVLAPAYNLLNQLETILANAAQLLVSANQNVLSTSNFLNALEESPEAMASVCAGAQKMLSNYGTLIIDKDLQDFEKTQLHNLSSVRDVVDAFVRLVAGALRMPVSKLTSGSPVAGSYNGDYDCTVYEQMLDGIRSNLEHEVIKLDRVLEITTFGDEINFDYKWPETTAHTPAQKASIFTQMMHGYTMALNAGVMGVDDVRHELESSGYTDQIEGKELLPELMQKRDIERTKELSKINTPTPLGPKNQNNPYTAQLPDHVDRMKAKPQKASGLKASGAKPLNQ